MIHQQRNRIRSLRFASMGLARSLGVLITFHLTACLVVIGHAQGEHPAPAHTGASADSTGELTATTDFDSGGGAAITISDIDENHGGAADKRVEIELTDAQRYPHKGYMHFRLDNGAGKTVFIEITNLDESRMPESHRLLYTTDIENLDWQRMDEEIGSGFEFELPADEVYISNYHAYPYRNIVKRVNELEQNDYVTTFVIGRSHEGREMYAIRIADPEIDTDEALDYVMLTRQHPGEVQGSWHMDAAIDYILEVLEDPTRTFDNDYIFHCIPAANPDGIYRGIHRHDTQRNDLNRMWNRESPVEISNMKNYMRENINNLYWGFDFHASTNLPFNYPGVWYDKRAVDEDDLDIIAELVEATKSFNVSNSNVADNRSRSFIYNELGGVMVTTEVSSYWPQHSKEALKQEGREFIQTTVKTVSTGISR